jgi:hypothetical protein
MAHLTAAVNERAFNQLANKAIQAFNASNFAKSGSGTLGPFSLSYNAGVKLGSGTIDLQNDGTVRIKELDIIYNPLNVTFGIDIPTITIGGFCIIPNPFGGCLVRAPKITLFGGSPDISVPINFNGLFQSEISGAFRVIPKFFNNPLKGGLTDHAAHDLTLLNPNNPLTNEWQLFLDPEWVDIDIIDVADTAGNIIQAITDGLIDTLLSWAPSWARAIVKAILSPVIALIRAALDIVDDIQEFLSNLFGVSLGLFNAIAEVVLDFLGNKFPIFRFEDPHQILEGSNALIPILVPIRNVGIVVNDVEMVLTTDIG